MSEFFIIFDVFRAEGSERENEEEKKKKLTFLSLSHTSININHPTHQKKKKKKKNRLASRSARARADELADLESRLARLDKLREAAAAAKDRSLQAQREAEAQRD